MRVCDALKGPLAPTDSEILLACVLQCDRTRLFAHPEQELSEEEERRFCAYRARREKGEPVAYIVGQKEFYGTTFFVDSSVLIPRPSTEALVEEAIAYLRHPSDVVRDVEPSVVVWVHAQHNEKATRIVDVGTGSGIIACALADKTHLPVIATDVSDAALNIAQKNIEAHALRDLVELRVGSLLEPVKGIRDPFLLVSNPPYVPTTFKLAGDTTFEPRQALFGGEDGGDLVRALVEQATMHPYCVGWVIECRPEHAVK